MKLKQLCKKMSQVNKLFSAVASEIMGVKGTYSLFSVHASDEIFKGFFRESPRGKAENMQLTAQQIREFCEQSAKRIFKDQVEFSTKQYLVLQHDYLTALSGIIDCLDTHHDKSGTIKFLRFDEQEQCRVQYFDFDSSFQATHVVGRKDDGGFYLIQ